MKVKMILAPPNFEPERIHIVALVLKNFQNRENVEIQLFRPGGDPVELEGLNRSALVGSAVAGMPPELVRGATEEAAIACLLETFTASEIRQITEYLQERYSGQIAEIAICPLELPVPLGIGPISGLAEGNRSGFINFDLAPGYPLDFAFRGYYDLDQA